MKTRDNGSQTQTQRERTQNEQTPERRKQGELEEVAEQVDTKCKETVKTKEGTKAATMETIASSAKTEEATALEHSRREHSSQSSGRTSSQRSTRFWMKCLQAMLNRK